MIPSWLISLLGKVVSIGSSLVPQSVMAQLSKWWVKWALIGLAVLALVAYTNWKTYDYMRSACEQEKIIALQHQLDEIPRQVVEAKAVEDTSVKANERTDLVIAKKAAEFRKRAQYEQGADTKVVLDADFVRFYDDLRRMSNEAGADVSTSDPGSGESEVSVRQVRPSASQFVHVRTQANTPLELSVGEVKHIMIDILTKFSECRNNYRNLSGWNDGRERLEILRLGNAE